MSKEKRHHIRIQDRIFIRYRKLSPEEFEKKLEEYRQGKEQPWIDPLHPPEELNRWESLLKKLRKRDRELAGLLSILDQKIERILIQLYGQQCLKDFRVVEADLSAGGMRICIEDLFKKGEICEIDIGLMPEWCFLRTYGKVVRVEKKAENLYEVAFKFIWITEADQDRLVQHIFRRQVLQLKASKRVHRG